MGTMENDMTKLEEKPVKSSEPIRAADGVVIPLFPVAPSKSREDRKSRWSEPVQKKRFVRDIVFNPLQALMEAPILPISDDMKAKKKVEEKQSRWGPEHEKSFHPPPMHGLARNLNVDEIEYLIRLYRLDELCKKINANDFSIADEDLRSPSPDPVYDKNGVRTNTRANRDRDNLMREKQDLIEELMKLNKNFVPPHDYKPPKKSRKIFLPSQSENPDISYVGIVLGPRGATQKELESKTGTKISIRGKGSSQSKRVQLDDDEPLHVLIQGESDEAIEKATVEVQKLLRGDATDNNEHKKMQMLQLAAIQGTLKDDFCDNCSEKGHRAWACPNKNASFKRVEIKCSICGDRSHPTFDCPEKKNLVGNPSSTIRMQQEYAKFKQSVNGENKAITNGPPAYGTNFVTNMTAPMLPLGNAPESRPTQAALPMAGQNVPPVPMNQMPAMPPGMDPSMMSAWMSNPLYQPYIMMAQMMGGGNSAQIAQMAQDQINKTMYLQQYQNYINTLANSQNGNQ
eukprot:TRINITY_DN5469_c0_g1_i1.p1 TRINITY_DN5469_c0_g1~~TRINITY_DN5469_c0_g1_i1.p1  ORF type:complete len:545 (+),score=115.19 TRINITY_DN5469_c0_g1_i1:99-1637(+)